MKKLMRCNDSSAPVCESKYASPGVVTQPARASHFPFEHCNEIIRNFFFYRSHLRKHPCICDMHFEK